MAVGLVALNEVSAMFDPENDGGQNNVTEMLLSSSKCSASKKP